MPKFSIIIPVYNVSPYLRECLDSVLAQTFTEWEAICVDDGSTDDSGVILDEYAVKDSRFRVIHQANAGVSAARNAAMDVAVGEWIGFLDADDIWAEDYLKSIQVAATDDVDWVRTGWTAWKEHAGSTISKQCICPIPQEHATINDIVPVGWYMISICGFPVINFYNRATVDNVRFPLGIRIREDALFCFEMVTRARNMRVVASAGYIRRERETSSFYSPRRRDDTTKLLSGYEKLWQSKVLNLRQNVRDTLLEASTYWVRKDVRQWFELCADRTLCDELKVWRRVRKLLKFGAISRNIPGTRFDRLRWRIYLSTGWGRILLVNRLNLLGRQIKMEKT